MQELDIYRNKETILMLEKDKNFIFFEIFAILFILVIFGLIFLYKYPKYIKLNGVVKSENIIFVLKEEELNLLLNHTVLVNEEEYKVEVIKIDEPVYDENLIFYYNVTTKINLDHNLLKDNNVIELSVNLGKTTLYKQIVEGIKGGKNE